MTKSIPQVEHSASEVLHMAMELSLKKWKLGFFIRGKIRVTTVNAGDLEQLKRHINDAKMRLAGTTAIPVRCCYEAGRDGFWIHRYLVQQGVDNIVVDPASIQMNRRARQSKTDRLDVQKLVLMLVRHHRGEARMWQVVRVPTVEQEDARRTHRELERLKKERTQHIARIKSLLFAQGVMLSAVRQSFLEELDAVRTWNGEQLPALVTVELKREFERWLLVQKQIGELARRQEEVAAAAGPPFGEEVARLSQIRGIGVGGASVLVGEMFGWREFKNRREVGACIGLAPTPFSSGDSHREQGISKSGSRRVRALAINLAWGWLRHQPRSALTAWFNARFAKGGGRMRRVGIVGLARKLMIALWRFLKTGVVPDGALCR